jgi:hypothetical protein
LNTTVSISISPSPFLQTIVCPSIVNEKDLLGTEQFAASATAQA